jgi:hypothetical protein
MTHQKKTRVQLVLLVLAYVSLCSIATGLMVASCYIGH